VKKSVKKKKAGRKKKRQSRKNILLFFQSFQSPNRSPKRGKIQKSRKKILPPKRESVE